MPSVSNGDFAIADSQFNEPPSSSSLTLETSHTANMNSQGSVAAIDMATDHQDRRQVTVSIRPTNNTTGESDVRDPQQDQRQHVAGGQPLPPGDSGVSSSSTEPINIGITTRSARAPSLSNLSDYARSMLLHTKQQMDATSGSPPPAHLHVAGPAGNGQRYRSGSLTNSSSNNNPVGSSHNTSSCSRGTSQSTSPGRSQHHHNNSPHRHAHRQSLTNGTLTNGI